LYLARKTAPASLRRAGRAGRDRFDGGVQERWSITSYTGLGSRGQDIRPAGARSTPKECECGGRDEAEEELENDMQESTAMDLSAPDRPRPKEIIAGLFTMAQGGLPWATG